MTSDREGLLPRGQRGGGHQSGQGPQQDLLLVAIVDDLAELHHILPSEQTEQRGYTEPSNTTNFVLNLL